MPRARAGDWRRLCVSWAGLQSKRDVWVKGAIVTKCEGTRETRGMNTAPGVGPHLSPSHNATVTLLSNSAPIKKASIVAYECAYLRGCEGAMRGQHGLGAAQCPLSGTFRTSAGGPLMSPNDPKADIEFRRPLALAVPKPRSRL